MITIDEFGTVELRVATVKAAEPHPNADRLLVLKIDIGEPEERQLVAGIRAHYPPEELVGKQIIVVANLQPATLRGMESQGMLLAATDTSTGNVIVLSPEKQVAPGSKVG
jgi:methionyl-tRNA synthetase